jgi:formate dehydrogenase
LDFGTLDKYNSFIGSMAIIVLSSQDSVKDAAINVMTFLRDESCGQCTPCRVGTAKSVELLKQESPDKQVLESWLAATRRAKYSFAINFYHARTTIAIWTIAFFIA